ncbi:MAG TPA: SDR family NAD(P)-dependent oxidoreductase [Pseudonocardia sp.]|nr:SDR family NAD(P)-dependent oxidoreductase [Pseudonocardia sp.]
MVTGAASGIGRALAEQLASRGARLVLADRDRDALARVAAHLAATSVALDVADPGDNERLAELSGPPRLLCLNAGVSSTHPGPVWEAPPAEWRRVIDVNLGGVVNGLRAFVPGMLATGGHHAVLVTASLAGLATWPGGGPYAASKHAGVTVAEQAALALAGSRVTVTVLCPALVRTGMSAVGVDPSEVARQALEAVARGRFLVTPLEWHDAVRERGRRLAAGDPPETPQAS